MPERRSLKPLDGWSVLFRGRFEARHDGHTWTVDVDFLDQLERSRPGLSRAIGALSWTVLVIALVTGLGELMALVGIDPPFEIPQPFNTILGIAAVFAALERALRFKSNRWLD